MGLVIVGILDSSFLFMPLGNDLLVVAMAARGGGPAKALFYAATAALGSVLGCLILDVVARKGEQAGLEKHVPKKRLEFLKKKIKKRAAWGPGGGRDHASAFPVYPICGGGRGHAVSPQKTSERYRGRTFHPIRGRRNAGHLFRPKHPAVRRNAGRALVYRRADCYLSRRKCGFDLSMGPAPGALMRILGLAPLPDAQNLDHPLFTRSTTPRRSRMALISAARRSAESRKAARVKDGATPRCSTTAAPLSTDRGSNI